MEFYPGISAITSHPTPLNENIRQLCRVFLAAFASISNSSNSDDHRYLNMVTDRRKERWLLYGSAAALRLLLFFVFPSLPPLLTGRVEISTPVTNFKRCEHAILADKDLLLIKHQYRKVSFYTHITSPLTMEVFSTKHLYFYRCSLSYHHPSFPP
jgi:hypothetical protein